VNRVRSIALSLRVGLGDDSYISEQTVAAGRVIAHRFYAPMNRWTELDALDLMIETPQKIQLACIRIGAVSAGFKNVPPLAADRFGLQGKYYRLMDA
jgi:hypothetical protein